MKNHLLIGMENSLVYLFFDQSIVIKAFESMDQERIEKVNNILKKHYPTWLVDNNVTIKDCSKGYDNDVYVVSNQQDDNNQTTIVIRIPRKDGKDQDRPAMHAVRMQARVMERYKGAGVPVPSVLARDDDRLDRYMIESYMPQADLSEIYTEFPFKVPVDQSKSTFQEVGRLLVKMHSVKTEKYGGMVQEEEDLPHRPLRGELDHWIEYFSDFMESAKSCLEKNLFDTKNILQDYKDGDQVYNILDQFYQEVSIHLKEFNTPCLVHADVCSNNIRMVKLEQGQGQEQEQYRVNGIIDFADAISGDGLYDIGRILSHVYGDWSFIEYIENGYFESDNKQFTTTQTKLIKFYALFFCVWLLDVTGDNQSDNTKYNIILNNLLKLIK
ncbi:hypothetical protein DFA_03922 [Cavenderia fasciculata]|uniref:Aminoglycoside phosphotransferase domain-containing protein n=1 Tax=Cavenderia fasciculata TaxID=261658 RepID=F4Q0S7_CACFS|nr:uncharacterized protein DFA_03922 [Cavenderia fasciculata]EGG18428.1 hypothetical protein DFA_03922 [Cavenderia fasciculata]|eukprot:XP_004366332.1 hypothetical protein DFA_03922 [Cavenderia fasciculata]